MLFILVCVLLMCVTYSLYSTDKYFLVLSLLLIDDDVIIWQLLNPSLSYITLYYSFSSFFFFAMGWLIVTFGFCFATFCLVLFFSFPCFVLFELIGRSCCIILCFVVIIYCVFSKWVIVVLLRNKWERNAVWTIFFVLSCFFVFYFINCFVLEVKWCCSLWEMMCACWYVWERVDE